MKLLWSNPEGRVLAVDEKAMSLHVGKLPAPAPAPQTDLTPEQTKELRPIDWGSTMRIAGEPNMEAFSNELVQAAWPEITRVALIFANAPDQWPARKSLHDMAAERGTARAMGMAAASVSSPLEMIGIQAFWIPMLQHEIRTKGKFRSLEDLTTRVSKINLPGMKRDIARQIAGELAQPGPRAIFFAKTPQGTRFRGSQAPAAPKEPEDPEDERPDRLDPKRFRP